MRTITAKFMLAFVLVSVLSTLLVVGFTRWRSREELRTFLIDQNRPDLELAFANYYVRHGSWDGISGADLLARLPLTPGPDYDASPFTLVDSNTGLVILAGEGYRPGMRVPPAALTGGIPIQAENKTVGILFVNRPGFRMTPVASAYLERINLQVLLGGLAAVGMALVLGLVLSRTLTRPIRELTAATRSVASGALGQQVPVRSEDELGELAASFNHMSADLVRSLQLRRQMTADIAHELRTPISVILGHAEAVHDGVLQASPETFEIIREEAGRLEHLVEDLRTISLADAGELKLNKSPCQPSELLADVRRLFVPQADARKIALDLEPHSESPSIMADKERMKQVLANILDNALRYTPDGGRITMTAGSVAGGVEIRVQDSGPGVPANELDRIFERFHRAQDARSRDEGGSGLGLAIAKSIVEKHGGTIQAETIPGHGLTVVIWLPTAVEPSPAS